MRNITGSVLDHKKIDNCTVTRDTFKVVSTSRQTQPDPFFFVWTLFFGDQKREKKSAAKLGGLY